MELSHFLKLVVLGAIWGSSFLFIQGSVNDFGIFALVELRSLGAAIILLPIAFVYKNQSQLGQYWPQITFVALFNTMIPFCLFNFGLLYVQTGLAAILNATAPMFGVVIAYFYLKEKLGKFGLVGMLLGFVGVVLISLEQTSADMSTGLAVIALLFAALCYGIAAVYIKKHLSKVDPFVVAGGSQLISSILLLPLAIVFLPEAWPSVSAWWHAAALSFVCTGIALLLYFDLIAKVGPSKAITVGYLIPLFGVIWGYLFLQETLSPIALFGGALILIGVMFVTKVLDSYAKTLGKKVYSLAKNRN